VKYEHGTADYWRVHAAVKRIRGSASQYECECGEIASQWSYRHDCDMEDIENFDPLCVSCHFKRDRVEGWQADPARCSKISKNMKGNTNARWSDKLTESDVREIRNLYAEKKHTQKEIAKIFGISQTNVSMIVTRQSWTHV
jgi:hypothetical protein